MSRLRRTGESKQSGVSLQRDNRDLQRSMDTIWMGFLCVLFVCVYLCGLGNRPR